MNGLPGVAPEPGYPPDSRYASTPKVVRTLRDGRRLAYLGRRVLPDAATTGTRPGAATGRPVTIGPLDRLDTLAATAYANSLLWWRIADANLALDPDDLLDTGRRIDIPDAFGDGYFPGAPR